MLEQLRGLNKIPANYLKIRLIINLYATLILLSISLLPDVSPAQDLPLEVVVQTGHSLEILTVAFSPNGKNIATGSADNTAKLWDVASGRELRTFIGHTGDVRSVSFSPCGKYLITGSSDRTACLWEVVTGKRIRTFDKHSEIVTSVAYSPNGKYIVTGSFHPEVVLYPKFNTFFQRICSSGHCPQQYRYI